MKTIIDAQPERALWYAVIEQAIEDYHKDPLVNKDKHKQSEIKRIKDNAAFWLFRSKEIRIGGLAWICEVLGLSIEYIRKRASEVR